MLNDWGLGYEGWHGTLNRSVLVAFAFCIVTVWICDVTTSEVLVDSDPRMSFHDGIFG